MRVRLAVFRKRSRWKLNRGLIVTSPLPKSTGYICSKAQRELFWDLIITSTLGHRLALRVVACCGSGLAVVAAAAGWDGAGAAARAGAWTGVRGAIDSILRLAG